MKVYVHLSTCPTAHLFIRPNRQEGPSLVITVAHSQKWTYCRHRMQGSYIAQGCSGPGRSGPVHGQILFSISGPVRSGPFFFSETDRVRSFDFLSFVRFFGGLQALRRISSVFSSNFTLNAIKIMSRDPLGPRVMTIFVNKYVLAKVKIGDNRSWTKR